MRTELTELEKTILDYSRQPIGVVKKLTSIWLQQEELNDKKLTEINLIIYLLPSLLIGLLQFVFIPSLFFKVKWDLSNLALYQGVALAVIVGYELLSNFKEYIDIKAILKTANKQSDDANNQLLSAKCVMLTVKKRIGNRSLNKLKHPKLYIYSVVSIMILNIVGFVVMIAAGVWWPALILIGISFLFDIPKNKLENEIDNALYQLGENMSWSEKFGWGNGSKQTENETIDITYTEIKPE